MIKPRSINILMVCYLGLVTGLMDDSSTDADQHLGCAEKKNHFITEYKRLPENRYVAEYKRFPEYRYSFGIGKRWFDPSDMKRNSPYSFGMGKRFAEKPLSMKFFTNLTPNNAKFANYLASNDEIEDSGIKRGSPLRSYDFGIGKRNAIHGQQNEKIKEENIETGHDQPLEEGELDAVHAKILNTNDDRTWDNLTKNNYNNNNYYYNTK